MYLHAYPPAKDALQMACTCARHKNHFKAAA
jgi:hypothetical protein